MPRNVVVSATPDDKLEIRRQLQTAKDDNINILASYSEPAVSLRMSMPPDTSVDNALTLAKKHLKEHMIGKKSGLSLDLDLDTVDY
jgi:hypothetical protein